NRPFRNVERHVPECPELFGRRAVLDEAHKPCMDGGRRLMAPDVEPEPEILHSQSVFGHMSFPKCCSRRVKYHPAKTVMMTPSKAVYPSVQSGARWVRIAPRYAWNKPVSGLNCMITRFLP